MANRHLGRWEQAHLDFASAQRIDFSPEIESMRKTLTEKGKKSLYMYMFILLN